MNSQNERLPRPAASTVGLSETSPLRNPGTEGSGPVTSWVSGVGSVSNATPSNASIAEATARPVAACAPKHAASAATVATIGAAAFLMNDMFKGPMGDKPAALGSTGL